jgi:dTDP-4-dehydrorhamnose 3,5-epimerase
MVLGGAVYDVVVDIRKGSPPSGIMQGFDLSATTIGSSMFPWMRTASAHQRPGKAVLYKCTEFYSPKDERGIIWNDPALAISWPVTTPLLSRKDQAYGTLAATEAQLPVYRPSTG